MIVPRGSNFVISGSVTVWTFRIGRKSNPQIFNGTGISKRGNVRDAINNMKVNAIYKYRYANSLSSDDDVVANVRDYQVVQDRNFGERYIKFKKKNGKDYYMVQDEKTGKMITWGRYEEEDFDIEGEVELANGL